MLPIFGEILEVGIYFYTTLVRTHYDRMNRFVLFDGQLPGTRSCHVFVSGILGELKLV